MWCLNTSTKIEEILNYPKRAKDNITISTTFIPWHMGICITNINVYKHIHINSNHRILNLIDPHAYHGSNYVFIPINQSKKFGFRNIYEIMFCSLILPTCMPMYCNNIILLNVIFCYCLCSRYNIKFSTSIL